MILLAAYAIFATMDAAAIDGLKDAAACSRNRVECGGAIYQRADGVYVRSGVITSGKPFGVSLETVYEPVPTGMKVVGDFHVHICSVHNDVFAPYFSTSDAILNQGLHTVGYMLDLCTHNVHRYDPTQDDADDEEIDFKPHADGTRHPPIYMTIGHIVGWIP